MVEREGRGKSGGGGGVGVTSRSNVKERNIRHIV